MGCFEAELNHAHRRTEKNHLVFSHEFVEADIDTINFPHNELQSFAYSIRQLRQGVRAVLQNEGYRVYQLQCLIAGI